MTKYVKKEDEIELNKENLPRIFNQLINNPNIRNIEIDVDVGFLEILNADTCSRFQFGTNLWISDDGVYKAEDMEYTTCRLDSIFPHDWLDKLYDSDNVIEFSLNQKTKQLVIYTKEKEFSVYTGIGVMVFDEDDKFVEAFESETGSLGDDMRKHGYKKVNESVKRGNTNHKNDNIEQEVQV